MKAKLNELNLTPEVIQQLKNLLQNIEQTGTGKKRGRPRKEEVVTEKRKRGRPRKEEVVIEKRKRGRPRKEEVVIEKRKRGRPRKEEVVIEKRKRGRPRKIDVISLVKKSKGRPRKYQIDILNKSDLEVVPVLIKILENSDKPVHTNKLISEISKQLKYNFAEPTFRKVINYIRSKSLSPIVSVNGNGYEISFSKKKIQAQIESLNKRASCIVSSANGLKKFL